MHPRSVGAYFTYNGAEYLRYRLGLCLEDGSRSFVMACSLCRKFGDRKRLECMFTA